MTAGGLEVPIAKAAASAVSRMAGPAVRRYSRARNLRHAVDLLDPAEVALPDLSLAQADSVRDYVISPKFHVIVTQVALLAVEEKNGLTVTKSKDVIAGELTNALRACGAWEPGTLRQVVDVLMQDLSRAITSMLQQVTDAGSSARELAAYVANARDQVTAAVRNSEMLERLTSLAGIHKFEADLRYQVWMLSQKMRVTSAGALRFVPFDALYVEASLRFAGDIDAAGFGPSGSTQAVTVPGSELFDTGDRVVLLGDPGGGKSTLAAKTVHDLADDPAGPVPLQLALRDYVKGFQAGNTTIAGYLAGLCQSLYQVEPPSDALEYLLLNGRAVVIFDGLDEVFEPGVRTKVIDAIHGFAHRYPNTPILITSRKVGYAESPLDAALFPVAELQDFSPAQVAEYAHKWFALEKAPHADKFIAESELVADLRANPLMLSLMCGLYRADGYIPAHRPDVYEKCALLLFKRWDEQRDIDVPFDAHVQEAVQALAWRLCTEPDQHAVLTRAELQDFMTTFLQDRFGNRADAANEASSFIDFCTGRAWILSKMGTSGEEEVFGFTHRTFLEYFAAIHLVRRYPDGTQLFEQLAGHLRHAEWEVVGQLALQALKKAVANGINDFLTALLDAAAGSGPDDRSNLLAFAERSLAFTVPSPAVVSQMAGAILTFFLDMPDGAGNPQVRYLMGPTRRLYRYDRALASLRECTGELAQDIGRAVVASIAAALGQEPVSDNVLLACEDPAIFLGGMAELPAVREELGKLSARYHARLQSRPFIWHDVRRAQDAALPIGVLLDRYGAKAMYLSVCFAAGEGDMFRSENLYSMLVEYEDDSVKAWPEKIVRYLVTCRRPWCSRNVVMAYYGARGHDRADIVNRGEYIAAILLLALPLIEFWAETSFALVLNAPHMLSDIVEPIMETRRGVPSAQSIRNVLESQAVPGEAADFVVRWANREFDLLAPG